MLLQTFSILVLIFQNFQIEVRERDQSVHDDLIKAIVADMQTNCSGSHRRYKNEYLEDNCKKRLNFRKMHHPDCLPHSDDGKWAHGGLSRYDHLQKVREALAAALFPSDCLTLLVVQHLWDSSQVLQSSNRAGENQPQARGGVWVAPLLHMAKTACKERCYREYLGYMGRCLLCKLHSGRRGWRRRR